MDMQDVSNLTIPEGQVKTIHDKDNRLLWGRIAYDVKYKGDTTQDGTPTPDAPVSVNVVTGNQMVKVSAKNLLPFTNQDFTFKGITYKVIDGTLYIDGTSDGETSSSSPIFRTNFSFTLPAGTYTFSLPETSVIMYLKKLSDLSDVATVNGANTKKATFVLNSDTELFLGFYVYRKSFSNKKIPLQLEKGSTSSDYEPCQHNSFSLALTSKNLFNPVAMANASYRLESDGAISIGAAYAVEGRRYFNSIALKAGTYTLSFVPTTEAPQELRYSIRDMDTSTDLVNTGKSFVNGERQAYTFTLAQDYRHIGICLVMNSRTATGQRMYLYDIQLELNQTGTPYEPYYDYKLCEIGTYQDYIYHSSGNWYVHKAINKVILDGSEVWSMYSGRNGTFYMTKSDIMPAPSTSATPDVISDYYEPKPFASLYNMIVDYGVANHNAQRWLAIRNKDYSDVSSFKTWLASNNTTVYYVLATPTDTQIADATLISQLNAVHGWLTRYGYNATVSGDLPIVLQRDSLQ